MSNEVSNKIAFEIYWPLEVGLDNGIHERAKGKLISKGIFGIFNSSKKQTKNFCHSRQGQKLRFSSSLFGRIEDTKTSF